MNVMSAFEVKYDCIHQMHTFIHHRETDNDFQLCHYSESRAIFIILVLRTVVVVPIEKNKTPLIFSDITVILEVIWLHLSYMM